LAAGVAVVVHELIQMKSTKTHKWYISHEILYFQKTKRSGPREETLTVWENLVLIKARNPEEAYRKALKRGRLNEEKVKIDGDEGYCKFKGLRDLVLIYDKLEDGAELEWRTCQANRTELSRMIKPKQKMQAFNLGPWRT